MNIISHSAARIDIFQFVQKIVFRLKYMYRKLSPVNG